MKLILSVLIFSASVSSSALAQSLCAKTLLLSTQHLEIATQDRAQYIRDLESMDIGDNAYVVRWNVKDKKYAGPLAEKGEFVVSNITTEKRAEWLDKVGNDSIGFIVGMSYAGNLRFEGTAFLRIGSTIYPYNAIQNSGRYVRSMLNLKDLNKAGNFTNHSAGMVEATIKMLPEEIDVIRKFVETRLANQFTAAFDVEGRSRTIYQNTVILPDFNSEAMGLFTEGCAGACASWALADWQAHSKFATELAQITEKYGLVPSPVARQLVWRNSRNPHFIGLTILEGSGWYAPLSFIKEHNWANLRGMALYGTIPDPIGPSKMVDSKRIPLKDWLKE